MKIYFYLQYFGLEKISFYILYFIPLFILFLGFLLYFFPVAMLSFTKWLEKQAGAIWLPSEKTKTLYKFSGAILLILGSFVLGYTLNLNSFIRKIGLP